MSFACPVDTIGPSRPSGVGVSIAMLTARLPYPFSSGVPSLAKLVARIRVTRASWGRL
ncbi:hypothetical protein HRbin30_00890 [bacterium HR30]|nr:hypothetical protein HRbin30_00890 [bacterium HR30]